MRPWSLTLAGLGIQLLGCASGDPSTVDAGPAATFIDVQLVLNGAGCTESGCHGSDMKGGLDLVSSPWEALVDAKVAGCADTGRKRVVRGDPQKSYLLNKVRGTGLCSGTRMPKGCGTNGGPKCLTNEDIAILESWIRGGAGMD
jgi:hypothetical protein